MKRSIAALVSAGAVLASPLAMAACPVAADAPDLARMGPAPVGVSVLSVDNPGRRLAVTLWYPAKAGGQGPQPYSTVLRQPGRPDQTILQPGCAIPDAPVDARRAPLVVISHGYGGWGTYMADLAELLASRGYVVAAVDHDDLPFRDAPGFARSFAWTAVHRADDLRAVVGRLRTLAAEPGFSLGGAYDPDRLAIIGYSMGGFGALAAAGAGYDPQGPFYRRIPGGLPAAEGEGNARLVDGLKALVLISPWGGQGENRAWTAEALGSVRTPTLVAVGDMDDVSGFEDGVLGLYDGLTGAERYRLTFANARHNLVGVDVPEVAMSRFDAIERFDEPVWRKDRLRAITGHYIVAFLDARLAGRTDREAYLAPTAPGREPKGFQRRWGLGFSLRHDPATR